MEVVVMFAPLRIARLLTLLVVTFLTIGAQPAHSAEEVCDSLVPYLWSFQPGTDATIDSSWDGVNRANTKLRKGSHRLAAPGSVDRATAYPFPHLPASVATALDRDTLGKVKALYDRYVLLERSIEDNWKDSYAHNATTTGMQNFASERNSTVQEMGRVAKSAKDEFVRFAFRTHSCFDQYESFVAGQHKEIVQQLANAQATLRANEEIWAHAEAPAAVEAGADRPIAGVKVENLDTGKRSPSSMPAIVSDPASK
jgi:hypothetical protein